MEMLLLDTVEDLLRRVEALEAAAWPNPHFKRPTVEEVWQHVHSNGWDDFKVEGFLNYWEDHHWTDKKGVPVKNWKRRAGTWHGNNTKYSRTLAATPST